MGPSPLSGASKNGAVTGDWDTDRDSRVENAPARRPVVLVLTGGKRSGDWDTDRDSRVDNELMMDLGTYM